MLHRSAKVIAGRAARVTTLLALTAALGAATGCTFAMEMGPRQPAVETAAGGRTAAESEPTTAEEAPAPAGDEEEMELSGVALSVGSVTGSLRLAD